MTDWSPVSGMALLTVVLVMFLAGTQEVLEAVMLGAALCGYEIRLIVRAPAIGMNPYALAAGIAGCSLALLDIATT